MNLKQYLADPNTWFPSDRPPAWFDPEADAGVEQQLGAHYAKLLANSITEVQPVHWPVLDCVLIDWWYSDVVEKPRATDDGMPERT